MKRATRTRSSGARPGNSVGPMRNGGRHRCQPPLRRAKDPPNFLYQVPGEPNPRTSAHQLRRRIPPITPSEEEPCSLYSSAPAEASLLFRAARPDRSQSRPMFRGPSWDDPLRRPALPPSTRRPLEAASRWSKDHLFRRLVPAGPVLSSRKSLHIACRGDRTFGHLPHLRSRFRPFRRGRDRRPDHSSEPDSVFRVAPSEKCANKPVDNVDIGNNRRNLFRFAATADIER